MRNLASNGSFVLSKGHKYETWALMTLNDEICRFWKITTLSASTLQAEVNPKGYISVRGNVERGDKFSMQCTELADYPYGAGEPTLIGCSVVIRPHIGAENERVSAKIRADVYPRVPDINVTTEV
jgi:hypothetical protein